MHTFKMNPMESIIRYVNTFLDMGCYFQFSRINLEKTFRLLE